MASADLSDCIAMSEDGDWYAFPAEFTRGQVVGAIADSGDGWLDTLRHFRFRLGYVRPWSKEEDEHDFGEEGWHYSCSENHPHATLAWVVTRG